MHHAGQRTSIAPLAAASRRLRGAALGAPSVGMGWGRISLVIIVLFGCGFLAGGENFLLAIVLVVVLRIFIVSPMLFSDT